MTTLRVATYNVREYQVDHRKPGERDRYERVAQVVGEVAADVWCIQEIAHAQALQRLANATGLVCTVPQRFFDEEDLTACDRGTNGLGVGLMWNPDITPVLETLQLYNGGGVFLHGLVAAILDVGGMRVRVASTQLTPNGAPQNVQEAQQVVAALTCPDDRPPGILGSDSNGITGDRIQHTSASNGTGGGIWGWHMPDPYQNQQWHPSMVWQCQWRYDQTTGERTHWADRDAGDVLWSGGLHETGAVLNAPVEPTVGYWPPDDPFGDRDIDHVRVTSDLVNTVRSSWVHRSNLTDTASHHRPKVAELDL